jgi:hypothetical protein
MTMRTSFIWGFVVIAAAAQGGCYTYAVAARQPPPDVQQVPVDDLHAQTSVQWRYAWGLSSEPVWSPVPDPCHGQGIGKFEAQVTWYTEVLTLVTLGTVSPIKLTYYCATGTQGPIQGH